MAEAGVAEEREARHIVGSHDGCCVVDILSSRRSKFTVLFQCYELFSLCAVCCKSCQFMLQRYFHLFSIIFHCINVGTISLRYYWTWQSWLSFPIISWWLIHNKGCVTRNFKISVDFMTNCSRFVLAPLIKGKDWCIAELNCWRIEVLNYWSVEASNNWRFK